MTRECSECGKSSSKSIVGEELDAALGDIVRSLLKKPAEEAGNLIADGIGILGDRIRRKRELNTQLGVEEVRRKLKISGIDVEEISPPKEEEIHLLVSGLSLSDDINLREMWAGLFAKVLDPTSRVTAERPFISVLQSLSPMDAKIIDFIAFTMKTDQDLRKDRFLFKPKILGHPTPEELLELDRVAEANRKLQHKAARSIKRKAKVYGLDALEDTSWSDNLLRLGVIERVPVRRPTMRNLNLGSFDEQAILRAFGTLEYEFIFIDKVLEHQSAPPNRIFSADGSSSSIRLEVVLSDFGKRFVKACGLL